MFDWVGKLLQTCLHFRSGEHQAKLETRNVTHKNHEPQNPKSRTLSHKVWSRGETSAVPVPSAGEVD